MLECTFVPLRRGRYRCHQTGKIVKQAQLAKYRKRRFSEGRKPPPPIPVFVRAATPVVKRIPVIDVASYDYWTSCPRCGVEVVIRFSRTGPFTCEEGHEFDIRRVLS